MLTPALEPGEEPHELVHVRLRLLGDELLQPGQPLGPARRAPAEDLAHVAEVVVQQLGADAGLELQAVGEGHGLVDLEALDGFAGQGHDVALEVQRQEVGHGGPVFSRLRELRRVHVNPEHLGQRVADPPLQRDVSR